jgi:ribosomal protein RSM22 (predicted rRNA methylase)
VIYHNEQDMSLLEACRTNYYYGHNLDAYRRVDANKENFRKQYNIFRRYALFFSDPARLFKDPLLGLGTLFMKVCDLGAWAAGFLVAKAAESFRRARRA